jgi:transposase IS66 family protein
VSGNGDSRRREGETVQHLLRGFRGVLVSDFYAAYDSIECPQQKCLIHLMLDLNDEILNNPFDEEPKLPNSECAAESRLQLFAWVRSIVQQLDCCRCCCKISGCNDRMSVFNWSRTRPYACCRGCCLAGLTLLSSGRPKGLTSAWNSCFSFMRQPSSRSPSITRSHRRSA